MKFCRFCRKLLSLNNKAASTQARTVTSTKIPKDVTKHYKAMMKESENKNEKKIGVTLDNIFSDHNKNQVQKKMQLVKVTPHPGTEDIDRRAAVLVPLCYVKGEPSLLFMVRSVYLKNHRGEISFPGGMEDPDDRDLTHTALRETYEEIGLPMDQVEVWGEMQPSPSKFSGSWVTPVVGMCGEIDFDKLHLNPSEVEDVFTVTLSSLCDPVNQKQTQWRYPGTIGYTLPVFLGGKYRIWGLSAVVLHQFMTVLAPGLYKFKLEHRS